MNIFYKVDIAMIKAARTDDYITLFTQEDGPVFSAHWEEWYEIIDQVKGLADQTGKEEFGDEPTGVTSIIEDTQTWTY